MSIEKTLLYQETDGQARLAVLEDGELVELISEPCGEASLMGSLYVGRVMNVLPGMRSAFVDVGLERNAFLPLDDLSIPDAKDVQITNPITLKPGQELLVQLIKLPIGEKGAKLSACPTLPGQYIVLLPEVSCISISKKITDDTERLRLRKMASKLCPKGAGLILRTAAEGICEAALKQDIASLIVLWQEVSERAKYIKAPAIIHQPPCLLDLALRDFITSDVQALWVNDPKLLNRHAHDMLKLYEGDIELFALYRVDAQAEKACNRRVWLKNGGTLVFDKTEAMTVIDVNSGKFVGKQSLRETVLTTNLEAAMEIAKQLRLRDIGGIIIIDFIDMDNPEDRDILTATFSDALKRDRAKYNLLGLTHLGLMEMTRKQLNSKMSKPKKQAKENL